MRYYVAVEGSSGVYYDKLEDAKKALLATLDTMVDAKYDGVATITVIVDEDEE